MIKKRSRPQPRVREKSLETEDTPSAHVSNDDDDDDKSLSSLLRCANTLTFMLCLKALGATRVEAVAQGKTGYRCAQVVEW